MMDGTNPRAWLDALRHRATASLDVVAQADQLEAEARAQHLERRRNRLRAAGALDPEATAAAVEAIGHCPRVEGHPGSAAAAQAVELFLTEQTARVLVLAGPTGRGKSFAATWALAEYHHAGVWLSAAECRVAGWDELRPKAAASKLLVVDDLGRESTDWSARELGDLVELRFNRGHRTVITTNLTTRALFQRYGDRVESRLSDARFSRVAETPGPDLRRRRT